MFLLSEKKQVVSPSFKRGAQFRVEDVFPLFIKINSLSQCLSRSVPRRVKRSKKTRAPAPAWGPDGERFRGPVVTVGTAQCHGFRPVTHRHQVPHFPTGQRAGRTRHPTGVLQLQWGMRAPRHLWTLGAALLPQGSRVQLTLCLRVTRSTPRDLVVEHVYVTWGFFQVLPHRTAEKKKIKATPPGKQERDPRASGRPSCRAGMLSPTRIPGGQARSRVCHCVWPRPSPGGGL